MELLREKNIDAMMKDSAFSFPCRNFEYEAGRMRCELISTRHGYRYWKHATENNRGISRHRASKVHFWHATVIVRRNQMIRIG